MAFRRKKKNKTSYADPEALFRDRRHRTVQGLLSHQSDVLRRYIEEAFNKANVALELPTGSGKTLVGLLIAEFRRLTRGERALYLCPTRQLTLQVCEQSERKYGISATPFIGRKRDYDPNSKRKYQTGQTIAVAPYSALFNINPFFETPQLIILDDAHAAENYIASNWSLKIDRDEHKHTYFGLLGLVKESLPLGQQHRFFSDDRDDFGMPWIEKIPTVEFVGRLPEISPFLDENTAQSSLRYAWSLLRGHLDACHMYVSYNEILIRPYIPPSLTHQPFAHATQRVFMSATLGLGGDLERITGIESFHRLPIPPGWDKQGIGRRYFVFPEMSLSEDEVIPLIQRMVEHAGRALVLVPSEKRAEKCRDLFTDTHVYAAKDIETSKDNFISEEKAVAVLANRYDGIDLVDDECRLLIIEGLPKTGNLQEVYLMSRMVAGNLFKDRIRTRIVQAFGRCTRSATDYAAVVVIGEDFFDWLVITENRSLFHPELQGELIFGAEQAKDMNRDMLLENLDIFLEHSNDWE
ncbi:MAG: DEAD/DEAH box helicase [Sedimentisphaerales bacterium]|nr:DEAD/DEAH box helicase [Sedimentisphaerales bacterium]